MKKFLIPILIVPFFAMPGCSDIEPENNQVVVQKDESTVVKNEDDSLSKSPLITSYENAKAEGYQGSLEDWVQLVHLTETQPEVAKQQLEDQGLDSAALLVGSSKPSVSLSKAPTTAVARGGFGGATSSGG